MFNKVTLVGYLTKPIELNYTKDNLALSKSFIATTIKVKISDEYYKNEVCFIEIIFWGKIAEIAHLYLRKGSKVFVDGKLKYNKWIDKSGKTKSKHTVIVKKFQTFRKRLNFEGNYLPVIDINDLNY